MDEECVHRTRNRVPSSTHFRGVCPIKSCLILTEFNLEAIKTCRTMKQDLVQEKRSIKRHIQNT